LTTVEGMPSWKERAVRSANVISVSNGRAKKQRKQPVIGKLKTGPRKQKELVSSTGKEGLKMSLSPKEERGKVFPDWRGKRWIPPLRRRPFNQERRVVGKYNTTRTNQAGNA